MTECLNSDDDDEENQRRFAFSFVTMPRHNWAGAGIRIIHHVLLRFSLLIQECITEFGRLSAIKSSVNGSSQERGELITR